MPTPHVEKWPTTFVKRIVVGVPVVGLPLASSNCTLTQPLIVGDCEAVQIAKDWNVEPAASGFVTIVAVPDASAARSAVCVAASRPARVTSKLNVAVWPSVGVTNANA